MITAIIGNNGVDGENKIDFGINVKYSYLIFLNITYKTWFPKTTL